MKKPATFSTKIDIKLADELKNDLKEQGFKFSKPPYTLFAAEKKGIVCILYESGSLVVQGKEKDEFIEFYLEPKILKTFNYTHPEANLNLTPHIGVDEAGKGDFFGPLCIAGLYADGEGIKKLLSMGVKDSKKLSDSTSLKIAKNLNADFAISVVRIFPEKYNELYLKFKNLNHLLGWGHATVITNLVEKTGCKYAIIDQFASKSVVESAVKRKKLTINLEQRTKAEEDLVVAGASILARASFVLGLEEMGKKYNFTFPKGASSAVVESAKKFTAQFGQESLEKVAKIHFKTTEQVNNA
ncbi:MAG: ribonuclease HIII [Chlamydiae bacterium]|nr:ribonuclease HIII [Chlamydiota bacterium]